MPRRGPAPRKMGPRKIGPKKPRTPSPPPSPPSPPAAPTSQRDIFDEMMGSEVSSDQSFTETTAATTAPDTTIATPSQSRKSPRFRSSEVPGDAHSGPEQTPQQGERSRRRKSSVPRKVPSTQVAALKEIAKLQRTTDIIIPKLTFARLIREILMEYSYRDLRITPESLQCLQESAEIYAVQLMEDAYRCTLHRDRITLMPKDMKLALMLRKDSVML